MRMTRWLVILVASLGVGVGVGVGGCGDTVTTPIVGGDGGLDPCAGIACSGHGRCAVLAGAEPACVCDAGYHAAALECVADDDPCAGVTCSGHGQCAVADGAPTCVCDGGYRLAADGLHCELAIPSSCADVTCSGHGSCTINLVGAPYCACDAGYVSEGLDCVAGAACTMTMTEVAWLEGRDYAPVQQGALAVMGSYLLAFNGKLSVIDVADPAHPAVRSTTQVCDDQWGGRLAVVGTHAFMYCLRPDRSVLHAYDLGDPASPRLASTTTTTGWVQGIAAAGTTLYVVTFGGGFQVYDVSDAAAPVLVGSVAIGNVLLGAINRVVADGARVVISGVWSGSGSEWLIIDASDPAAPAVVMDHRQPLGSTGTAFAAAGGYVYGGSVAPAGLLVTDVSDPAYPRAVGALGLSDPSYNAGDNAVDGVLRWREFALVSVTGVTAVDLRSPSNPTAAAYVKRDGDVRIEGGVALGGDYLYAGYQGSETTSGLSVVALACTP